MQADVGQLRIVDRHERLGHAVDERLGADEADAGTGLGPPDQMLGAAEADFELNVIDRVEEQRGEVSCGGCHIQRKTRQQRLEQLSLARTQRMPLAPPVERAVPMGLLVAHRVR